MGKKGGATRLKRQMAPTFWNIRRKESQFVVNSKPGPHAKRKAYPLGMLLRDVLKVCNTMKEAQMILNEGKVKVDGVVRSDKTHPVGLMDVVELVGVGSYRMVPKDSVLLVPVPI